MSPESPRFDYALDQWPPPLALALLSLQWLMLLVPGIFVLADLVAAALELGPAGRVGFLQISFLLCGLMQAGQVWAGHRLPALVGPSTVMLVGVVATVQAGASPAAVFGAAALGGAAVIGLGLAGLTEALRRLFTAPVLAATLLLIAVVVAPAMRDLIFHPAATGKGWAASLLFALVLVCAMLGAQLRLKGILSSSVLLLGIALGSLAYYLLGLGPLPALALPGGLSLPALPRWGWSLQPGVIAAFALCYLALVANEVGSVESLGRLLKAGERAARLKRAVAWLGVGGLLAGLGGVLGTVSYANSPGVVLASRNASRFTLLPAAGALVLLGLWPGGLWLFTLVPPPVVGAVLLTVMATQIFAGLSLLLERPDGLDLAGGVVVGAAVLAGLVVSFMPPAARGALHPWLRPLLANGFVVGLSLAMLLEHLLLRRPGEPGRG